MVAVADYEEYASGKNIEDRPALLRLLEDAAAGKFDTVLVHKIDRWSRRLADLLGTVEFLGRHDVAFASATEPIDTTSPLGKLFLQILGSFAEFERGVIVERVTSGIEKKRNLGLPLASVGFGLRKDKQGVVQTDPTTFPVVERIFRDYTADRLGMKAIAQALQRDSLPTPGARPWSAAAVARVLRNRTFVGELPYKDGWVPGAHDPLLDVELFDAAQALAETRTTPAGARRVAGDFVLSGTIACGHCGAAYIGNTGTGRNKVKVRYYTCVTSRRYGKSECSAPSLPAEDLERVVADTLLAAYADSELFAGAVSAQLAEMAASAAPLTAELNTVRATLAAKQRLLAKYQADYEADRLDAELYSTRTRELREVVANAEARAANIAIELAAAETAPLPTDDDRAAMHELLTERLHTGPVPLRKALFAAVVVRLEVHAVDDVRPTFRLGADLLGVAAGVAATAEAVEMADEAAGFAYRSPGWS